MTNSDLHGIIIALLFGLVLAIGSGVSRTNSMARDIDLYKKELRDCRNTR